MKGIFATKRYQYQQQICESAVLETFVKRELRMLFFTLKQETDCATDRILRIEMICHFSCKDSMKHVGRVDKNCFQMDVLLASFTAVVSK